MKGAPSTRTPCHSARTPSRSAMHTRPPSHSPTQYNSAPVRRPSKASVAPSRRSNRSGSLTTEAPRVAVNPVMHSHATVMDSAAAIEDEESRKVTEAAFCY